MMIILFDIEFLLIRTANKQISNEFYANDKIHIAPLHIVFTG